MPGEGVTLGIKMHVPAAGFITKAVDETLISSVHILVFEYTGTEYQYAYLVPGYALTNVAPSEYEFYARISSTDEAVKLYLVANFPMDATSLLPGSSETEIKQALTGAFTAAGLDGGLPMSGEIDLPDGVSETPAPLTASMVRSVARVDVLNSEANFTLTSVQLYRVNNQYQVIPNTIVNNIVTTASVPSTATQTVNTVRIPVTAGISVQQLYLPESALPLPGNRQEATVVVIGGIYGTDPDAAPTFYRVDFVPEGNEALFGQVLRNHLYQIDIQEIRAPGWTNPDEAAESESTQITAEIVVWNEETVYMVYDEVRYLGVSTRIIQLASSIGSQKTLTVQTNLETYDLYWVDANGNIDERVAPITWGDSFSDYDDLFDVSISGDGTTITVIANSSNSSGSNVYRYLQIRGGRLQVLITIDQGIPALLNASLTVYSSTTEIGTLGNQILGNNLVSPNDRTRAMVALMQRTENFSPTGVVPIQRILIGGQAGYQIDAALAESFNVLYLTYAGVPNAATTNVVLDWLAADTHRILMVQYDNTDTNANVMNALGFPTPSRYGSTSTAPFTLYPDAPAVITEGVFGEVADDMQFRCYDTIHGEINLTDAIANGISPILIGGGGGVVLGVDFTRRIVYSGDIDMYSNLGGDLTNRLVITGEIINDPGRLIANLWAWIATTALSE